MLRQRTLRAKATCSGVGLHSGQQLQLEILPASEDNGITFIRTDKPRHAELRACIEQLGDTTLATTLQAGVNGSRVSVGTVEHLLAAFTGLGIDNAQVLIDGPEIPVLDGSAGPFVEMLRAAGLESQRKLKRFIVIKKDVEVRDGDKLARIAPGRGFSVRASVDFDHPLIPPTPFKFEFSERSFAREVAWARTFGFLKDVEMLQARGLARGGSLDNAVVIDEYSVLNPEGLRYPDEFVRHKVLDSIGDLSLAGAPIIGKLEFRRSGHALNTKLVKAVMSDPRAYEIIVPEEPGIEQALQNDPSHYPLFEPIETMA
ncbi:MAG: UDP-3-O-[3-hydroxymyristoyl] N-acetylglucosamine deacetylase [Deltaproteobacteria bacterium RIFOXYB12_FULL_58_9]|nr:MAG: UDP-3-O-[3-hydroxymyristoyl] N-acetylglucosamine deacetylase [Deltaproteobacteria bacterium RIFOXYB12_FULL_58_9]